MVFMSRDGDIEDPEQFGYVCNEESAGKLLGRCIASHWAVSIDFPINSLAWFTRVSVS